jgi:hypothetical protein
MFIVCLLTIVFSLVSCLCFDALTIIFMEPRFALLPYNLPSALQRLFWLLALALAINSMSRAQRALAL